MVICFADNDIEMSTVNLWSWQGDLSGAVDHASRESNLVWVWGRPGLGKSLTLRALADESGEDALIDLSVVSPAVDIHDFNVWYHQDELISRFGFPRIIVDDAPAWCGLDAIAAMDAEIEAMYPLWPRVYVASCRPPADFEGIVLPVNPNVPANLGSADWELLAEEGHRAGLPTSGTFALANAGMTMEDILELLEACIDGVLWIPSYEAEDRAKWWGVKRTEVRGRPLDDVGRVVPAYEVALTQTLGRLRIRKPSQVATSIYGSWYRASTVVSGMRDWFWKVARRSSASPARLELLAEAATPEGGTVVELTTGSRVTALSIAERMRLVDLVEAQLWLRELRHKHKGRALADVESIS